MGIGGHLGASRLFMSVRSGHNTRKEDRYALNCPVQLSWRVATGETRAARGTCVDVSTRGACIECSEPVEARSNLYLKASSYGMMGNASVRYCVRRGLKYHIGLEFSWAAALAEEGRKQAVRQVPHGA